MRSHEHSQPHSTRLSPAEIERLWSVEDMPAAHVAAVGRALEREARVAAFWCALVDQELVR